MVNGKLQRKYLILLVPRAESNHRHCDFQSRRNRKEFNNLAPDRLENVPIVINKLIAKRKTRATGCHFYVAWAEHPQLSLVCASRTPAIRRGRRSNAKQG